MIDFSGQSALHIAANGGQTDVIEVLIQYQAQVDLRDSDQRTPLMTAAAQAQSDAVQILLGLGADASLKCNTGGWKASDYARMQGEDVLANMIDEHYVKAAGGDYPESNESDVSDVSAQEDGADNATPQQAPSSAETPNVDDSRSDSMLSEGMSEGMSEVMHLSNDVNISNDRDGAQGNLYRDGSVLSELSEGMSEVLHRSNDGDISNDRDDAQGNLYRDGSVLSELSEGMSEVQNHSRGNTSDVNDRNDADHMRQQNSLNYGGGEPNISEGASQGQESEFELSDADGSDEERDDNGAQRINLRDVAAILSQGNTRSESAMSEGMSEVVGNRSTHSQSGSTGKVGGSSEVSSGMQELAQPGVDAEHQRPAERNARPEAPANLYAAFAPDGFDLSSFEPTCSVLLWGGFSLQVCSSKYRKVLRMLWKLMKVCGK